MYRSTVTGGTWTTALWGVLEAGLQDDGWGPLSQAHFLHLSVLGPLLARLILS